MRRSTRFLLGASVALITALSLQLTVGKRFHHMAFKGHHYGCGYYGSWDHHQQKPEQPAPDQGGN